MPLQAAIALIPISARLYRFPRNPVSSQTLHSDLATFALMCSSSSHHFSPSSPSHLSQFDRFSVPKTRFIQNSLLRLPLSLFQLGQLSGLSANSHIKGMPTDYDIRLKGGIGGSIPAFPRIPLISDLDFTRIQSPTSRSLSFLSLFSRRIISYSIASHSQRSAPSASSKNDLHFALSTQREDRRPSRHALLHRPQALHYP